MTGNAIESAKGELGTLLRDAMRHHHAKVAATETKLSPHAGKTAGQTEWGDDWRGPWAPPATPVEEIEAQLSAHLADGSLDPETRAQVAALLQKLQDAR